MAIVQKSLKLNNHVQYNMGHQLALLIAIRGIVTGDAPWQQVRGGGGRPTLRGQVFVQVREEKKKI